jgi:hypothetical protein
MALRYCYTCSRYERDGDTRCRVCGDYMVLAPEPRDYSTGQDVVIAVMVIVMLMAAGFVILFLLVAPSTTDGGARPNTIGLASGVPTNMTCGTSGGYMYREAVSITSTSGTITTATFGLKLIPTAGGLAVAETTPPSFPITACPATAGYFAVLYSAAGTPQACWTGAGEGTWGDTQADCGAAFTGTLPVTLTGGMTIEIYTYGLSPDNPAGAFTVQAYGTGDATVSGSADL